jgi:hypothetical protein
VAMAKLVRPEKDKITRITRISFFIRKISDRNKLFSKTYRCKIDDSKMA